MYTLWDEKTNFHPYIVGFIYFVDVNSILPTVKIALGIAYNTINEKITT